MKPIPTVFVVDDDGFVREMLRRIFVTAGIAVRTFASATDLLVGVDFRDPCVLLLDVNMPHMSGPELQVMLRERGVDVPVIFLTASADIPIVVAAMRNGAVDFLEKPFDTATLLARVRQTLARHEQVEGAGPAPQYARRLNTLTPREREVLPLMVTGQSSKRIARELGGSFRTIQVHRARVMDKMAATTVADLVRMSMDTEAETSA